MVQTGVKQSITAYQEIKSMIMHGDLREGYPLLEVELAERLSMSRTPVREALLRLRADGLIERVRGKGFHVKALSKDEVRQNYEYLEGIEGMVSYLLAGSMTDEEIEQMERHVVTMEDALKQDDIDTWAAADTLFHQTMMDCCHNQYMVAEMQKINMVVRSVREVITKYALDKERSTQDHRRMVEAIREHDPEKARHITQAHISNVRAQLMKIM